MPLCRRRALAGSALAFRLDGRAGHGEADPLRRRRQRAGQGVVLDFGHPPATAADQELRRLVLRMGARAAVHVDAADEGRHPLQPVHQSLVQQEFQRAIYGGRGAAAAPGAQPVEQLIGPHRGLGFQHEAEHVAAQRGQPGAALGAQRRRTVQQGCRARRDSKRISRSGHGGGRIAGMNQHATSPALLDAIRFDAAGLVPAIAQQHDSGEVLMMAWMNREAVAETLATGVVCYFSRSRSRLWRKGESSGQVQRLVELRLDCDGDTLLLLVDQEGVACHTGRRNCFFRAMRHGELVEIAAPEIDPGSLYGRADG